MGISNYARHHRLDADVLYFVGESGTVTVRCAAEQGSLDLRERRLLATDEKRAVVDIGNDKTELPVDRQQSRRVERKCSGVGVAASLFFSDALAVGVVEKLHRVNVSEHGHR